MAIKAGQILHVAGGAGQDAGLVVDRISTAGVSSINVNETTLEELGNYESIGTIREIPDLSFEIESFDPGTELEEILLGGDGTQTVDTLIDFTTAKPIDVLSPFKNASLFTTVRSIAIPYLILESFSYSFSLNDPMTQSASLKGDSVFYVPGSVYREEFAGDDVTTEFTYTATPALSTSVDGVTHFVLGAMLDDGTTTTRLRLTDDYTATATALTMLTAPATGSTLSIIVGAATPDTYLQAVHVGTGTPIASRGRDIKITLDADGAGNGPITFVGVQSASVDWRVTLERDEEFGNPYIVAQDYDIPEVSGSITMKGSDATALFDAIQQVVGLSGTAIVNATNNPAPITIDIEVANPDTGVNEKTLYVPDAKFQLPAIQGSVGSKLEVDFAFTSEGGNLEVWKRNRV